MSLRIVFMGTPDFSVPTLRALAGGQHEIVTCYTQPSRPAGRRGLKPEKSPVHEIAERFDIPVLTPVNFKSDEAVTIFKSLQADVAVVVAYGLLLPPAILEAPLYGCYNGHASLLPRWRGAAPVQRALMAGDRETGINIMKMDHGLDTGPVVLEERVAITSEMTANVLHDRLAILTAECMVRAMAALECGTLKPVVQAQEGISYAHKIKKEETRISWSVTAQMVHNHIRALSPFPGAWCEMKIGNKTQRVKILASEIVELGGAPGSLVDERLAIACDQYAIRPIRLQRAGGQAQGLDAFLHGNSIACVL